MRHTFTIILSLSVMLFTVRTTYGQRDEAKRFTTFTNIEGQKEQKYISFYGGQRHRWLNVYQTNIKGQAPRTIIGSDSTGFFEVALPVKYIISDVKKDTYDRRNQRFFQFLKTVGFLINDCSQSVVKQELNDYEYNLNDLIFIVKEYNNCKGGYYDKNALENKANKSYISAGFIGTRLRSNQVNGSNGKGLGLIGAGLSLRYVTINAKDYKSFFYINSSFFGRNDDVFVDGNGFSRILVTSEVRNLSISSGYNVGMNRNSAADFYLGLGLILDFNSVDNNRIEKEKLFDASIAINFLVDLPIHEKIKFTVGSQMIVFGTPTFKNIFRPTIGIMFR